MEGDDVLLLIKGEVAVEGLRGTFLKKMVVVANSAAAEAPKDLNFVHSSVNQ